MWLKLRYKLRLRSRRSPWTSRISACQPAGRFSRGLDWRTVRRLQTPKAPPEAPAAHARPRARGTTAVRARGHHHARELAFRRSAFAAGAAQRPPTDGPALQVIPLPTLTFSEIREKPSTQQPPVLRRGERFVAQHKRNYRAPAAARLYLRDTPSSQGQLETVVFVCEGRRAWSSPLPLSRPPSSLCRLSAEMGTGLSFAERPKERRELWKSQTHRAATPAREHLLRAQDEVEPQFLTALQGLTKIQVFGCGGLTG